MMLRILRQASLSIFKQPQLISASISLNKQRTFQSFCSDNKPKSPKNEDDKLEHPIDDDTNNPSNPLNSTQPIPEDNDSSFELTQKLIDKIMSGEVEFKEGDTIDKLMTLDDVFQTRERRLSFQLMSLEDPKKVLQLYQDEKTRIQAANEGELTADEYALFFHFATFQKRNISSQPLFLEIYSNTLKLVQKLSPSSLEQFVWSLGSYVNQYDQLDSTEDQRIRFAHSIIANCKSFEISQNASLAFAVSQIFQDDGKINLAAEVVAQIAKITADYIETLSHEELLTFLLTFSNVGLDNTAIIETYLNRLRQIKGDLNETDVDKACSAIGDFVQPDWNTFSELASEFLIKDGEEGTSLMSAEVASNILLSLSNQKQAQRDANLLKKLFQVIEQKSPELSKNSSAIISVWLALAKLRVDTNEFKKVIDSLQELLQELGYSVLQNEQLVRLAVAKSALKLEISQEQLDAVQIRLKSFTNHELLLLARATQMQIGNFESFAKALHTECLTRQFGQQEKQLIAQTFKKLPQLFKGSPFLE